MSPSARLCCRARSWPVLREHRPDITHSPLRSRDRDRRLGHDSRRLARERFALGTRHPASHRRSAAQGDNSDPWKDTRKGSCYCQLMLEHGCPRTRLLSSHWRRGPQYQLQLPGLGWMCCRAGQWHWCAALQCPIPLLAHYPEYSLPLSRLRVELPW